MAYCLAALALACFLRAIPEMASPYPVGYDAPLYAYHVEHILEEPLPVLLKMPPLFYLLCWALLRASGTDALHLLKFVAPLTYGSLAFSFYAFLRKGLGLRDREALLCVLVCFSQLPTLRLSWDLFRNEFGLALALAFITIVEGYRGRWKWALASLMAFLTALSHQLAFFLIAVWSACRTLSDLRSGEERPWKMPLALVPALALFSYQLAFFLHLLPPVGPYEVGRTVIRLEPEGLGNPYGFPRDYFLTASFLGYSYARFALAVLKLMAVCYLPILPPVLLGLRRHKVLEPLVAWPLLATLTALLCPHAYPFYSFSRWLLFLVFPLSVYATWGLGELRARARGLRKMAYAIPLAYLIMGLGYASGAFSYIVDRDVNAFFPRSLVESTIGLRQIDDCLACLDWLNDHAGPNSVLITEQRFYGWALNFLEPRITIALYPHGYPLGALSLIHI